MKTILSIITMLTLAAFSFGEQQADVLSVKSGKAKFMVLQPDTNKGIRNAPLGFVNANDRSQRQNVVTDENGLAVVDLAVGRYVLELGKEPITILDASVDGQLEEIRLMPERLAVGGQDTTDWRPIGSSSGMSSSGIDVDVNTHIHMEPNTTGGWSTTESSTTTTRGATGGGWSYVGGNSGSSNAGMTTSGTTYTGGTTSGATNYSGDWRSLGEARVVSESELQSMGAIKTSGALSGQTYTDGSVSYGEWQSVGGGTYTEAAAPVVNEGWGYVSEDASVVTEYSTTAEPMSTSVAWAGAGEACLVNQDGVDYIDTAAGLVAIADGSYSEDASGNYVQGADGVWWKIADCGGGAAAKGKKKPLLILAAGIVAAIIIADNVDSDDDDGAAAPTTDTTPVAVQQSSSGGSSSAVISTPAAAAPEVQVVEEVVTRFRTRTVFVNPVSP